MPRCAPSWKSAAPRQSKENAVSVAAAVNERDGYGTKSRIEETMHFAQLLGVKKIGIATCAGLIHEANALARVLRAQGYEVTGIACKCGTVNKTELGIPERCLEVGQNICNPVLTETGCSFSLCYSCLALERSTPRKCSLVILNITGLSAKSAMKFGIAMRPLSVSAMFHTKSSEETLPITITMTKMS